MPKWKTWISDQPDSEAPMIIDHLPAEPLPPIPKPTRPSDVPKPVRDSVRKLAADGHLHSMIATVLDLPVSWVELFVSDPNETWSSALPPPAQKIPESKS